MTSGVSRAHPARVAASNRHRRRSTRLSPRSLRRRSTPLAAAVSGVGRRRRPSDATRRPALCCHGSARHVRSRPVGVLRGSIPPGPDCGRRSADVSSPFRQYVRFEGWLRQPRAGQLDRGDTARHIHGTRWLLQATRAYVDWIERGDPLLLGASYWAPVDRQMLIRVIPGREPIPYDQDEHMPSATHGRARRSHRRVGHRGGVLQFRGDRTGDLLASVGMLFGLLAAIHCDQPYSSAMLGVTILPLVLQHPRAIGSRCPAQIGEGIAVIGLCYFLGRITFVRAPARLGCPSASANLSGRRSISCYDSGCRLCAA